MNETTIERLFWDMGADSAVYEERFSGENSELLERLLDALSLDFKTRDKIGTTITAAETEAELHGFVQGFKIGAKLAAEIYGRK